MQYFPEVFEPADLRSARSVILTDEGEGADTDTRWAQETPVVTALIGEQLGLSREHVVLDYGSGIGRLARALIERFGCFVIGVDVSRSMRSLAPPYVASNRFMILAPEQLDVLVHQGLRVDAAIAVWVLQHAWDPAAEIARIERVVKGAGGVFVLNMHQRAVPVVSTRSSGKRFEWASDGRDVMALLQQQLMLERRGKIASDAVPQMAESGSYWATFRTRGPVDTV